MSQGTRKLAAIMFTDVVGFTALTQDNESGTVQLLEEHRKFVRPIFAGHGGHEIKTIGDAFLVEFGSALDATLCAIAIQHALNDRKLSKGDSISIRIGVHVGDVIEKENDVLGDAVNIASRIEPLAEPGGICVSREVYSQVKNKIQYPLEKLPQTSLKNVREEVEVFRVVLPWMRPSQIEQTMFPANRIAILPFASFSSSPDDAYFADGVTDEIISAVSGISGISVISRTSVIGYKGTTKKVREIGKELEVGSVLEGSFKKAGNRIRVTTQLISVSEDKHLWAQNYDRNLDDVFEVQSDIAKQVAEALRVRILSPEKERIEKLPTTSTPAYLLYLKGRQLWNTRRLEDVREAFECFKQAVEEDPNFALGYAGQADCCSILRSNFMIDSDANLARAKELVGRALGLDPDLAEARATNANIMEAEHNFQAAEEEYKAALALKPSYAFARLWYSRLLRRLYRWEEALKQIERAEELDPLSPIITVNRVQCLDEMGRTDESLHVLKSAERLNPHSVLLLCYKAVSLMTAGKMREAGECLDRASQIDSGHPSLLDLQGHFSQLEGNCAKAIESWRRGVDRGKGEGQEMVGFQADFASVYWLSGEKEKALDCVKSLEALPEDKPGSRTHKMTLLGWAYAGIGDSDRFFSMEQRLVEENQADFSVIRVCGLMYPSSREFYRDRRWGELFARAGLKP